MLCDYGIKANDNTFNFWFKEITSLQYTINWYGIKTVPGEFRRMIYLEWETTNNAVQTVIFCYIYIWTLGFRCNMCYNLLQRWIVDPNVEKYSGIMSSKWSKIAQLNGICR